MKSFNILLVAIFFLIVGVIVDHKRPLQDDAKEFIYDCQLQLRKDSLFFTVYEHRVKILDDSLKQYRVWLKKAKGEL